MEIEKAIEKCKLVANGKSIGDVFWGMSEQEKQEMFSMAVNAMEKQLIPKRPKVRHGRTWTCPPDCGGEDKDEYGDIPYCPICGKELNEETKPKHCSDCGQKINWEAQNEATK